MRKLCLLAAVRLGNLGPTGHSLRPSFPRLRPGAWTTTPMFAHSSRRIAIRAMDQRHSNRACGSTCGRTRCAAATTARSSLQETAPTAS